jgi:hypothetical protein
MEYFTRRNGSTDRNLNKNHIVRVLALPHAIYNHSINRRPSPLFLQPPHLSFLLYHHVRPSVAVIAIVVGCSPSDLRRAAQQVRSHAGRRLRLSPSAFSWSVTSNIKFENATDSIGRGMARNSRATSIITFHQYIHAARATLPKAQT